MLLSALSLFTCTNLSVAEYGLLLQVNYYNLEYARVVLVFNAISLKHDEDMRMLE